MRPTFSRFQFEEEPTTPSFAQPTRSTYSPYGSKAPPSGQRTFQQFGAHGDSEFQSRRTPSGRRGDDESERSRSSIVQRATAQRAPPPVIGEEQLIDGESLASSSDSSSSNSSGSASLKISGPCGVRWAYWIVGIIILVLIIAGAAVGLYFALRPGKSTDKARKLSYE